MDLVLLLVDDDFVAIHLVLDVFGGQVLFGHVVLEVVQLDDFRQFEFLLLGGQILLDFVQSVFGQLLLEFDFVVVEDLVALGVAVECLVVLVSE